MSKPTKKDKKKNAVEKLTEARLMLEMTRHTVDVAFDEKSSDKDKYEALESTVKGLHMSIESILDALQEVSDG